MDIDIITVFPEMFPGVLGASILKRAQQNGRLQIAVHDLRRYTHDKRRTVDDRPYGGGPGMILKPGPLFEAVEAIRSQRCQPHHARRPGSCQTILMAPAGEPLSSALSKSLSRLEHILVVCGHYEGVDERVRMALADRLISIGDYVLTGGELPAMVLVDCLARFIPGVLGHERATEEESFASGWLEYPQYTRPAVFRQMAVPEVLRCGNHGQIARWRKLQAAARTLAARPELLQRRAGPSAMPGEPVRRLAPSGIASQDMLTPDSMPPRLRGGLGLSRPPMLRVAKPRAGGEDSAEREAASRRPPSEGKTAGFPSKLTRGRSGNSGRGRRLTAGR